MSSSMKYQKSWEIIHRSITKPIANDKESLTL